MSDPLNDPLTFAPLGESDAEDVPLDADPMPMGPGEGAALASPLDADPLHTTRTDTLTSYGQLVAPPPAYEDAPAAEPPEPQAAAAAAAPPAQQPAMLGGEISPAPQPQQQRQQQSNGQAAVAAVGSSSSGGAGSPGDAAGPSGSAGTGPLTQPLLVVSVSDPVKKVEQGLIPGVSGGYVTYKVTSETGLPGYASRGQHHVRRRFKDFVALANLLGATHRGYFIPPRPDKNPVEGQRASVEFVETRRLLLERYLQLLAEHPVLARSQELRVFLEAEGQLGCSPAWTQLQPLSGSVLEGVARLPKQVLGHGRSIPNPVEAAQSTSRTGDLLRRLKEFGTSMKGDFKASAALPQDEAGLRGEAGSVEEYQEALAGASRKAERMVKRLEEYGGCLGDLGLAFIKVAKFEDEDGGATGVYTDSGAASKQMSADTRRVGMAAVRLSRLSRSAVQQDMGALTALHEELGLTPCILKALREREGQLLTYHSLQDELEKKRRAIMQAEDEGQRVFGGDKAKQRKVAGLRDDAAALEAALGAAEAEYERVKTRNKEELTRWRAARAHAFSTMLDRYGRVEAAYAHRSLSVWLGVAEEFGAGDEVVERIQAVLGEQHDAGAV